MLLSMLVNTPTWGWGLLIVLIYFALKQSRDHQMSTYSAFLIPIIMTIVSLNGAITSFGDGSDVFFFWCLGLTVTMLLGILVFPIENAIFDSKNKGYFIKGSWLPMILILCVFVTRYSIRVLKGMHSASLQSSDFVANVSLFYGVLSGMFAVRMVGLWRLSWKKNTFTTH